MKKDIESEMKALIDSPTLAPDEVMRGKLVPNNVLSLGSTMINLACSGIREGGLLKGRYYIMVGASQSGKTWMYHAIFAESTLHPKFKNYRLIKDEPEHGSDFDVARYFGVKTAARIEKAWPGRVDENGNLIEESRTIEEFYDNVEHHLDECESSHVGMIYVLDSMDSLGSEKASKINEEAQDAREAGKEVKGNYGDGKAKVNSQRLRDVVARLDRSGSILIIICQERDNLGSPVGGKTFSGGNALLFYACVQFWFKKMGAIDTIINGKKRALGTSTKCQIIKNRLTGRQDKDVVVSYYYSFGIDDVGDMIDYLVDEGHWARAKAVKTAKINAAEFEQELPKEQLAHWIQEEDSREEQLKKIVEQVWNDIQKQVSDKVTRRMRYE